MLIELATHLEEKAARLKHEGLGKIKIALAGCNTSSLLDTLEGAFGFVDQENISTASISEMKESTKEEVPLSLPILSSKESGFIAAELVFSYAIHFPCSGWDPRILLTPSVDQKHSHITGANSLIVYKFSYKKWQPVLIFIVQPSECGPSLPIQ